MLWVRVMDNYRGITVTDLFYKLLEHICLHEGSGDIDADTSGLQFGFTSGRSPAMASLVITEAIADAREARKQLFIASLDARKAFDVVNQSILKSKLFQTSVKRPLWAMIDDLYMNSAECIRWKGVDSDMYSVSQGVKQGGVLSPLLYKTYINDLLVSMRRAELGLQIGGIYLGTPTVADDVLLMSTNQLELQAMLNMAHDYSVYHEYEIHPQKSVVVTQVRPSGAKECRWMLGDKEVTSAEKFTHLGLDWTAGQVSPNIEKRIKTARATAYSMIGIGLHGHNGLDPPASLKSIISYVVPRLLHGLEATVLKKKELDKIDRYYRGLLRQIQGLPGNAATESIYLLLGTTPITAHLHRRMLSLLGSIARLPNSNPLRLLALRQLATKSDNSNSWFNQVRKIGLQYGININSALTSPWPKTTWKNYVTKMVNDFWILNLRQTAATKSTLSNIIHWPFSSSRPHPLWLACKGNNYQTKAATVRARMLIGRYPVQSVQHRVYKRSLSPICLLCEAEEETLPHLISSCTKLEDKRRSLIAGIRQLYSSEGLPVPTSPREITSAVLNGGSYEVDNMGTDNTDLYYDTHTCNVTNATDVMIIYLNNVNSVTANKLSNMLCYRVHIARDFLLSDIYMNSTP